MRVSYLVCATPRSGSTLLCEGLKATGVAGRPEEYFEALPTTGPSPHARRLSRRPRRSRGARGGERRAAARAAAVFVAARRRSPRGASRARTGLGHHAQRRVRREGDVGPRRRPGVAVPGRAVRVGAPGRHRAPGDLTVARDADPVVARRGIARLAATRSRSTASARCGTSSTCWTSTTPPGPASSTAGPCSSSPTRRSRPTSRVRSSVRLRTSASNGRTNGHPPFPAMRRQADDLSDRWAEAYARDLAGQPSPT